MCGIVGSLNYNFSEPLALKYLGHRGPDEHADYQHANIRFFHLRLSILDISLGKQPMSLNDKYTIIYNGEIFNHQEIRNQYGLSGKTSSDTETILLLYDKFGTDFLNLLDGMFAFAIHDKTRNQLFIVRDRAGEKPLYYYSDKEKLVFASELNTLNGLLPLEIDKSNLYSYLRFGSLYRNLTPYHHVHELEAGHFMVIDCNTLEQKKTRWWNIHQFYKKQADLSLEEALTETDQLLHTSVKRRIENSDLEVGAFLSGGIDSGLVTSVAKGYNPLLKTFTISFEGEYDEAPLARLVADKYQTNHTEIKIGFDHLKNDVEKILLNYGEPFFDSSAIPSYYVSKAAKEHVTVILNGDGADELFGGYRRNVPFSRFDFFQPNAWITNSAKVLKQIFPEASQKKSLYNYLVRLLSLASKTGLHVYLSAGVDIFENFEKEIRADESVYLGQMINDFSVIANSDLSGLKKLMNLDFDVNLCNDLLVKMDIATMANSQEGRSPFLSKEFLEFAPTIPDHYLIKGKTTKFLLRKLAEKYLPAELIHQPKRGFEIPLKNWVNGELNSLINDYLQSSNTLYPDIINKSFVSSLLEDKVRVSPEKRAKMLWTIFALEVWYQNRKK